MTVVPQNSSEMLSRAFPGSIGGVRAGSGPLAWPGYVRLAWREARPSVQLMFQLRFLAGALLCAVGPVAAPAPVPGRLPSGATLAGVLLGALAWLCVTWHIYLLNGICDQTEDRHNGSGRPLASGTLPVRAARAVATGLAVVAVGLGAALGWVLAVLVLAMLGLGWAYSAGPRPQKANVPGFIVVVTAGGLLTYLAGWLCAGGARALGAPAWLAAGPATGAAPVPDPALTPLVVLAAAMSLWMSLGGMTKDLSDIAGDRAAGRRTLPVLLGDRRARTLMAVLALGVGGGLCAVAALAVPVLLPAGAVLLAGGAAVASCLASRASRGRRGRLRIPYRAFMTAQYAVHGIVLGQCLLAGSITTW